MKKHIALFLSLLMVLALAACGKTAPDGKTETDAAPAVSDQTADESTAEPAAPETIDVTGLNWVRSELDCYGYSTGGVDCYLSFDRPDSFLSKENNDDGEQYRGYYYNPANPDATPNESPYGIYAYFMQGGYGATRASFDEDVEGGLQERELGGRTVLFGELPADENTGSHAFVYYVSYSEDDWARIWVILTDPEADGAFRQTFEQSMRFVKE